MKDLAWTPVHHALPGFGGVTGPQASAAHPACRRRALVMAQSPGLSTHPAQHPVLAPPLLSGCHPLTRAHGALGDLLCPRGPTTQGGPGDGDRAQQRVGIRASVPQPSTHMQCSCHSGGQGLEQMTTSTPRAPPGTRQENGLPEGLDTPQRSGGPRGARASSTLECGAGIREGPTVS